MAEKPVLRGRPWSFAFVTVTVAIATVAGFAVLGAPAADADGGAVSYYYSASTRTFYRNPPGVASPPGPNYRYTYQPMCEYNSRPDQDVMCTQATAYCANRGLRRIIGLRVFRWQGPGDVWQGEPFDVVGAICPTPAAPATIPLDDVVTDVQQRLNRALTMPSAHLNPQSPGIVNLPVIAWADGPDAIEPLHITVPFDMLVTATAAYHWTFGDGATASGKGAAYDGTDPAVNPGHYPITHAFRYAGTYPVTLTQTWDVHVFAPAVGGLDPDGLDIDAPAQHVTHDVAVRSLDVVLVN